MLDMSSWDTLHMQGTSYLIVLIFECAQNIEIGMNRYTAFVSQIAGIAPFIRVKEYWVGGRCRKTYNLYPDFPFFNELIPKKTG